jgi:hypothetical protein
MKENLEELLAAERKKVERLERDNRMREFINGPSMTWLGVFIFVFALLIAGSVGYSTGYDVATAELKVSRVAQ